MILNPVSTISSGFSGMRKGMPSPQPRSGIAVATAVSCTPGTARTSSSTCWTYCVSATGSGLRSIRQRQVRGDDSLGVVAGIDVHHALKAANQQPGAREQDERGGHLRGDEDVPRLNVPASRRTGPSAFFQRFGGVAPRRMERRRQPEHDAR